jgi:hypothetical protein
MNKEKLYHFWLITSISNVEPGITNYSANYYKTVKKLLTKYDLEKIEGVIINISYLGEATETDFNWTKPTWL